MTLKNNPHALIGMGIYQFYRIGFFTVVMNENRTNSIYSWR